MKTIHSCFMVILTLSSLGVYANSESQKINSKTTHLNGCPLVSSLELAVSPEKKLQIKMENKVSLEIKEENYQEELISGTTPDVKQCFIAVKNAESQVNESYSLFILSPENKTIKPSRTTTITNPDFTKNIILTSYRDAARWHYDSLCYSNALKDYYICERREEIYKGLEKRQECTLDNCAPIRISLKGKPDAAVKIKNKTYIYRESDRELTASKSYLIAGDNVNLIDFKETEQAAYFQIQFNGKIVGWVEESSLIIQ